LQNSANVAT